MRQGTAHFVSTGPISDSVASEMEELVVELLMQTLRAVTLKSDRPDRKQVFSILTPYVDSAVSNTSPRTP